MKREYKTPEAEIEKFLLTNDAVYTDSTGLGGGDQETEVDW